MSQAQDQIAPYQPRFVGRLALNYVDPKGNKASVAINRVGRGADGAAQEEVDWVRVVTWEKLAETCNQYLQRGSKVYVEGRLQTRSWDGEDGQKHYITDQILLL